MEKGTMPWAQWTGEKIENSLFFPSASSESWKCFGFCLILGPPRQRVELAASIQESTLGRAPGLCLEENQSDAFSAWNVQAPRGRQVEKGNSL